MANNTYKATEHRPRSSSRASHTTSSRRADYAPSELSLRGEQGSNDESDRLKTGAPKTKVKRRSLTRPEYPSRDGPRRISRSSEQHIPPEMIWENGATPEEAAVLVQKKERRLVREKEKEKERERDREREKEREKERELSRAERREKRLRAKEERAKAREGE